MASRLQFISISIEYLQQIWMVATTLDRVPSLSYNQTVTLTLGNYQCCWKKYIVQL